jgi:hypothetical protein
MLEEIYTDPEVAVKEIKRRWKDNELEEKISKYLSGDVPSVLNNCPKIILIRHITTPDNEARKLIEYSKKFDIELFFLEYTKDKFVSFNYDKYTLLIMFILLGRKQNGQDHVFKFKISDINLANSREIQSLKTIWGESLVDFHHSIFSEVFPEYKDKIFDLSLWLKNHGEKAKIYYEYIICLLLRNCILLEDFQEEGTEGEFTKNTFYPLFKKVEMIFGIKPLVVKLAPEDAVKNSSWWYYRDYIKDIVSNHINQFKNKIK